MLQIDHLTKSYHGKKVLDAVSMQIEEGRICGLVGLNGAGKSTLMKIVCGLVYADSGTFALQQDAQSGKDVRVGFMIETPSFYNDLSGKQNLLMLADLYGNLGKEDVMRVLKRTGLTEHADKLYKSYSLGMKQRLYLAYAIMNHPQVLILDEPFNGIDPVTVKIFKDIIREFASNGSVVLLSAHSLPDIASVCDSIYILDRGKVVYESKELNTVDLEKTFLSVIDMSGEAQ